MKNQNVKRLTAFLMVIAIFLLVCGCKNSQSKTADSSGKTAYETDELLKKGYTQTLSSSEDGIVKIEYASADRTDFVLAKCKMSEKQEEAFFEIDSMADDYFEQCSKYINEIGNVEIESLNDKIPEQSEFEGFIGKTLGFLEENEFSQSGVGDDSDGFIYFEYSNDKYTLKVKTNEEYEALFDIVDKPLNDLTVKSVSFYDFVSLDF